LPLSEITIDQFKAIRSGLIKNWREVGGPDLPIQQFERDVNSDMIDSKANVDSNLDYHITPLETLQKVAEVPGSFAPLAAPLSVPQCSVKVLAIVNSNGKRLTPYKEPLVPSPQCKLQKNQVNLAAFSQGEYPKAMENILYVVIRQNGQIEQQVGEAYTNFLLSGEGQKALAEVGYVGILSTVHPQK
jgi:phosphate transport system substrate-binding protein